MTKQKPAIPGGTRDFNPGTIAKRRFIFDTIRGVFEKYGYQPIETPSFENLETLTGKYGDEGDQLLFKILNSRLHESKNKQQLREGFELMLSQSFNSETITERALRYDLTVPFARYVVMHQNEIVFPFRRYQMQPVWRADRPQRGRYREFWQCDADVVGSQSLLLEAELIKIYDEVFSVFRIPVVIKLNNRKVLSGMAESINATEKLTDITVAIDKLDKIGLQGVRQELHEKGISESQMQVIEKFFTIRKLPREAIELAGELLINSDTGMQGLSEMKQVIDYLDLTPLSSPSMLELDFSLARGLNYYTGAIIEVKPTQMSLGSLGGGGRYDNLTGMFGLAGISGVGISFGADRIFDAMEEHKLFTTEIEISTRVLFACFDDSGINYALPLVQQLRGQDVSAEIYPSPEKMKKQLKYANDKKIEFVIVIGDEEIKSGKLAFKNMISGEQQLLSIDEIIDILKKK